MSPSLSRTFLFASIRLILPAVLIWIGTAAVAQSPEVEIDPFQTDRDDLGEALDFHGVVYNDTTGKLLFNLPPIGPGRLALQGAVRSSRRVTQCETPQNCVESEWSSIIGHNADLGYGRLLVYNPMDDAPPLEKRLPNGRVSYIDPQGNGTQFKRDYLFQDIDPETEYDNHHFIDAQLRRITRDLDVPFGQGRYYLLDPNGTKTVFEPYLGHVPGGVLSAAQLADPQTLLVFYPVEIVAPDGRRLTITYLNDLTEPANADPKATDLIKISHVDDDWYRRLFFKYYGSGPFAGYLEELGLGTPANTFATTKKLMRFDYVQSGDYTRLAGVTTPEGYRTELRWKTLDEDYVRGLNVLDSVRLPSGLEVALTHGLVEIEHDRFYPTKHLRVLSITKRQASGSDLYRYSYDYQKGIGLGTEIGAAPAPHSWLKVTLDARDLQGGPSLQRTSYYYNNGPGTDDNPLEGLTFKAGQLKHRITSYTDGLGTLSTTREDWDFSRVALWNTVGTPPSWLLNQGTIHKVVEADTHKLHHVRPTRYRKQSDGIWTVLDLTYDYNRDEGMSPQAGGLEGALLQATELIRYPETDPGTASRQRFTYDSIYAVVQPGQSAAGHAYILARRRGAEEAIRHDGLAFGTIKKIENDYRLEPHQYVPGSTPAELIWPLVTERRLHAGSGNYVRTITDYYNGGPYAGLQRSTTTGSSGQPTQYTAYQFGQPSRVEPPLGLPEVRFYNIDETVKEEEVDGVRTGYTYDHDGRVVRVSNLDGEKVDELTRYATPAELLAGNHSVLTQRSDRWERETRDIFDRTIAEAHNVQAGVEGEHTRTEYDLLGNARLVTRLDVDPASGASVVKAVVKREFDVQGRLRREWTSASPSRLAQGDYLQEKNFTYSALTDGDMVKTSYYNLGGRTGKLHARTDFFERQVNAGMETADTPGQIKYTHFSYRFDGDLLVTVIQPEGHDHYRMIKKDWLDRMVLEMHPETEGTTRYVYNDRGLLLRKFEAGGPAWYYVYDARDRLVETHAMDPATGQPRHLVSRNHYNAANQVEKVESGNGVLRSVLQWDALNRPLVVQDHIPELDPAPTSLEPQALQIENLDHISFSWEGNSHGYILEFGKDSLPTLVFDVTGSSWVLGADQLVAAVEAQVASAVDRAAWLAAHDPNSGVFLDTESDYRWRIRGVGEHHVPTANSEWVALRDAFVRIEPADLHFGDAVAIGDTVSRDMTFTNVSTRVLEISLPGDSQSPFSTDTDVFSLQPGAHRIVTWRYAPTEAGDHHAHHEITVDLLDPFDTVQQSINLTGTAVDAGLPDPYLIWPEGFTGDFGAVPPGDSVSVVCTVTNRGGGVLNGEVRLEGDAAQLRGFSVAPVTYSGLLPHDEAPESQAQVTITFSPEEEVEAYDVTAVFTADYGSDVSVSLRGRPYFDPEAGTMFIPEARRYLNFGQILDNETASKTTQLLNIEPDSTMRGVTVTLSGPDVDKFRLVESPAGSGSPAACGPLRTDIPCYPEFVFDPNGEENPAGESFRATATFNHPGDAPIEVQLQGTAKSPPKLNVSLENTPGQPVSIYDFGQVLRGVTRESVPLRINNEGGLGAAVFVTITGPDYAAFGTLDGLHTNTEGIWIDGHNYASTILTFSPQDNRVYEAVLQIAAPEIGQSFQVNLRGEGQFGTVFAFDDSQEVRFPAGGVGRTVTLPLKLINNSGTFIDLTVEGTGDFAGNVSPYGGQGGGGPYQLPLSGSYGTDFLEFTIPRKGPASGTICFRDAQGSSACLEFSGEGTESMTFLYSFENTAEPVTTLKPVSPSGTNRERYDQVKKWGFGRPIQIRKHTPAGRIIELSVPEPFQLFEWDFVRQYLDVNVRGVNSMVLTGNANLTLGLVTDEPGQYEARVTAVIRDAEGVNTGLPVETYQSEPFVGEVISAQIEAPETYDFGTVPVGVKRSFAFDLANLSDKLVALSMDSGRNGFVAHHSGLQGNTTVLQLSHRGTPGDQIPFVVDYQPETADQTDSHVFRFVEKGRVVHQLTVTGRGGPAHPEGSFATATPLSTDLDGGIDLGALGGRQHRFVPMVVTNNTAQTLEGALVLDQDGKGELLMEEAFFSIPARGSVTLDLDFWVVNPRAGRNTVLFSVGGAVHHRVPVRFESGDRPFEVDSETLNWGSGPAGRSLGRKALAFTNTSSESQTVSIASSNEAFVPVTSQIQVAPGTSGTVAFEFTPAVARAYSGSLLLTVNGDTYSLNLLRGSGSAIEALYRLDGEYLDAFNQWYFPEGVFYRPPHEDLNEPQIERLQVTNMGREAARIRVELAYDTESLPYDLADAPFEPPVFDHLLGSLQGAGHSAEYELTYHPYIGLGLAVLQVYVDDQYRDSTLVWVPFPRY
ncbi:Choice-of-anchor D domain-containing protein [Sulfidibacter corallicola]|uniref:Choice-of-anchor D domain-containing protein n=1 Tax=Sulfidibacter corallicola TaxID=2818388 RepID=A0A8A4TGP6_SULCO|nr:choice-of-anchor D domain-containing protein [Sulfidibacter corallicola]QTD48352.1 choice-of-anchor D domain-containing protein [Sulfidibacter corallicola]